MTPTPNQLQAARLVAEGLTAAQIARRMHLSARTVQAHVAQARKALGAVNSAHLVYRLHEEGLMP